MKQCKTCLEVKPLSDFFSNGTYKGRPKYKPSCSTCEYRGNADRLRDIIELFYGKLSCQRCGYDKYFGALECHHRDPSSKDFMVKAMRTFSKERILIELKKCDLLCSNCHREVHAGL